MKPTLLVLAAGMGSRYGGLKQLDGLGPNGETLMDYSIYDAIQAGFGKVVEGIDVVDKIANVKTGSHGWYDDVPRVPVVIESVVVVED